MRRCTRCVLGASFPGISFAEDGVCSYCRDFDIRRVTAAPPRDLEATVSTIVDQPSWSNRRYDAVVAYSGGKDSSFLLHLLQEKYKLRLLAVTFDNGFLCAQSIENMRAVTSRLNTDHITIRYRQDHLNAIFLNSALFRVYPEHLTMFGSGLCISCIRMVMSAALRTAIEKRVPMVMLGNSPGQVLRSEAELVFQDNRIPYALRRQLFASVAEQTGTWAYDYLLLSPEEYRTNPFPYFVSPLPMVGYDEAEIYRTIASLGWKKPDDVDPNSTNCRLNSFGILRHKNIYNFHPYEYEMSQLVRLGSIGRDAALDRIEDRAGTAIAVAQQVEKDLMCNACRAHCGGC
jgi:tRNA(Ile)-lysidine synthase TilS/MesJ